MGVVISAFHSLFAYSAPSPRLCLLPAPWLHLGTVPSPLGSNRGRFGATWGWVWRRFGGAFSQPSSAFQSPTPCPASICPHRLFQNKSFFRPPSPHLHHPFRIIPASIPLSTRFHPGSHPVPPRFLPAFAPVFHRIFKSKIHNPLLHLNLLFRRNLFSIRDSCRCLRASLRETKPFKPTNARAKPPSISSAARITSQSDLLPITAATRVLLDSLMPQMLKHSALACQCRLPIDFRTLSAVKKRKDQRYEFCFIRPISAPSA